MKILIKACAVLFAYSSVCSAVSTLKNCSNWYRSYSSDHDNFFQVFEEPMSFYESRSFCQSLGASGELAIIRDDETFSWIGDKGTSWIGLWNLSPWLSGTSGFSYIDGTGFDSSQIPNAHLQLDVGIFATVGYQNLAKGKPTSQSSTEVDNYSNLAVDGRLFRTRSVRSSSITRSEMNPWWEVDLLDDYIIKMVVIHNHIDCCPERLKTFVLSMKDSFNNSCFEFSNPDEIKDMYVIALPENSTCQFVRISLRETQYLSLAEVEVFGPLNSINGHMENVAIYRGTGQSSTNHFGYSQRAVDGNRNPFWHAGESITHTYFDVNPWWQVDLAIDRHIVMIVIYNRQDCCSGRLRTFWLSVKDSSGNEVFRYENDNTDKPIYILQLPVEVKAKMIRISLRATDALSLAEVEVYGSATPEKYFPACQLSISDCDSASCPPGSFLDPSLFECRLCPLGRYSVSQGSTICATCPTGNSTHFIGSRSAADCFDCPEGKFSSFEDPICRYCPLGKFALFSNTSSFVCNLCPRMTFAINNATGDCTPCKEGYFSFEGSTICSQCPSGTFPNASLNSSLLCTKCPAMTYGFNNQTVPCLACPSGRYSLAGWTVCLPNSDLSYETGCADGVREWFLNITKHPLIAGCAGAFQRPGTRIGDNQVNHQVTCQNAGGNDGPLPFGQDCSISDLCAEGWHLCEDAVEVASLSGTGDCDTEAHLANSQSVFFATAQSSVKGQVCSFQGVDGIYGCGKFPYMDISLDKIVFSDENLLLWLDASNYSSFDSGNQWLDKSKHCFHFNLSSSEAHQRDEHDLPLMDFSGSYGHSISSNQSIPVPLTGTYHIFIVTKINILERERRILFGHGNSDLFQFLIGISPGSNLIGINTSETKFVETTFQVTPGMKSSWNLFEFRISSNFPFFVIFVNGKKALLNVSSEQAISFDGISQIGGRNGQDYWGQIRELMIFDGVLLNQQRDDIVEYLLKKWNVISDSDCGPLNKQLSSSIASISGSWLSNHASFNSLSIQKNNSEWGGALCCRNTSCLSCSARAEVCLPRNTGYSDGTREWFLDSTIYTDIAGCAGAFDQPGLLELDFSPKKPLCGRNSGNDANNKEGIGCSSADLCEEGWRVCDSIPSIIANTGGRMCDTSAQGTFYPGSLFVSAAIPSESTRSCNLESYVPQSLLSCGNIPFDSYCGLNNVSELDSIGFLSEFPSKSSFTASGQANIFLASISKNFSTNTGVLCCREKLSVCSSCGLGYHQPFLNKTSCVACMSGKYQEGYNSSDCLICPEGRFSKEGFLACQPCPLGYFNPLPGKSFCSICSPGTFTNQTGESSCESCQPGYFSSQSGETFCNSCLPGRVSGLYNSTSCAPCEPGKYQDLNGQSDCLNCSVGKYMNYSGSIGPCIDCDRGKYSLEAWPICIQCSNGSFSRDICQSSCELCNPGSYQFDSGMSACIDCPYGTFSQHNGSLSCFKCSIGRFSFSASARCDDLFLKTSNFEYSFHSLSTETAFISGDIRYPGKIFKRELFDWNSPSSVDFGNELLLTAFSDSMFGFIGNFDSDTIIRKIHLYNLSIQESIELPNLTLSSVVHYGDYAYYGTFSRPGKVIKVNIFTLQVESVMDLDPGEDFLVKAILLDGHAYFCSYTKPSRLIKVNLPDLNTKISLPLDPGEDFFDVGMVIEPFIYVGRHDTANTVVKIEPLSMTRIGKVRSMVLQQRT